MQRFEVKDHADSLLPDGKEWKLIWNDEFDGETLDESRWRYRLHIMGTRHDTWVDDATHLDGNSNLIFELVEKDGHFYSSQLQTGENYMDRPGRKFERYTWPIAKISKPLFQHKKGYYECRCRLQQKEGWWSAFWLQSPIQGSTLDPSFSGVEIDIMESFHPGKVMHNIHWNGVGEDWQKAGKPTFEIENPEEFHIFGLLWDDDGYTFYVDGMESWHIDGPVSDTEQFILISTECMGYRKAAQIPDEHLKDAIGDTFAVDYVRVFEADK